MARAPLGFDGASHERHHGWQALLLRVAVCAGMTALLWWLAGWFGVLVSLAFTAQVMAPVVMDAASAAMRALRGVAFRPAQGRFYQFKGHRIRVEDDELLPQRWLALEDLATALGAPLPAVSLRRRWPQGLREQRDGVFVLDEAALAWLAEQRNDRAARLHHWVKREVWYPARGRRAGYMPPGAPSGAPAKPE